MNPVLKWVGGKRNLVSLFREEFEIDAALRKRVLVEPFAGGAAMSLCLNATGGWLNDGCEPLINFYESVKKNPRLVHKWYSSLVKEGIHAEAYYAARKEFNKNITKMSYKQAGHFLYLNRIGFQGMWRVNQRGLFNVPYGGYVNPKLVSSAELSQLANFLSDTKLTSYDFSGVLNKCGSRHVVYADPPYLGHFDAYTGGKFGEEEHAHLASQLLEAHKRGAVVIVSNSNSEQVRKLYPKKHWKGMVIENAQSITPHNAGPSSELALIAR